MAGELLAIGHAEALGLVEDDLRLAAKARQPLAAECRGEPLAEYLWEVLESKGA